MIIYNAHPESGVYLAGRDTDARENPKYKPETHADADRYIYNPRTSSPVAPPDTSENECAVLEDGVWIKKVNRVGQHYYQQDGIRVEIIEIGIDVPAGCIQDDPPTIYHTTHDGVTWIMDPAKKRDADKAVFWQEYLDYLGLGFDYAGVLYQCRPDDVNDWMMLKNHIESLPGETVIQIRAADNGMNSITVTEFLTLFAPVLGQHVMAARQAYWAKVDAI